MKIKKILIGILVCTFIAGLLSACAIDKKCPAYSHVTTQATDIPA